MKNIELTKGIFGNKAILKSEWQISFENYFNENNIKELELNSSFGWSGQSLDFLKKIPSLKSLSIIDFQINDISEIHCQTKLKEINISTYCKTKIDFEKFPELENCFFEWREGSESIFNQLNLKKLHINNFNSKEINLISNLTSLNELTISNSNIEDINQIFNLRGLRSLTFANLKKVTSIKGIQNLDRLEILEIENCKRIEEIEDIFELKKLISLHLLNMGNLKSISGISGLSLLINFIFYESTNILDGDLSELLKLNNLEKVSFQNRKHYSLTNEYISTYISKSIPT